VVVVQHDDRRAEIVRRAFERAPSMNVAVFRRLRDASDSIDERIPDIVVADDELPDGRAVDLLRCATFPLVVIVEENHRAVIDDAAHAGALECIPASEAALEALPRIVMRVMRKWNRIRDEERVAQLAAMAETAATLMHDIATPLNGMYIAGQLMLQRLQTLPDTDPKVSANLAHIVTETRRLTAMLEDYRVRWRRIQCATTSSTDVRDSHPLPHRPSDGTSSMHMNAIVSSAASKSGL
jgi:signal transduction histidine kinase